MKPGRPVLYELLKDRPIQSDGRSNHNGHAAPPPSYHHNDYHDPPAAPPETAAVRGTRAMRVPFGYVFVLVAVFILVGAVAYMFGYARGEADHTVGELDRILADDENRLIGTELGEDAGTRTPANGTGGVRPAQPNAENRSASGVNGGGAALPQRGENRSTPEPRTYSIPLEPTTDPRESGKNYYRLIQTTRLYAIPVAEFCRANGVEAAVFRADNKQEHFVVDVFPGFTAAQMEAGENEALHAAIREVTEKWVEKYGRPGELASEYLKKRE